MTRSIQPRPLVLSLLLALWGAPGVLAETRILPTLEGGARGADNLAYCPTLQKAWEELQTVTGRPVRMERPDPLLEKLNQGTCHAGVLPDGTFVAMASRGGPGFAPALAERLRKTFGDLAPALPEELQRPDLALVSYAYLRRDLEFPLLFHRSVTKPLRFAGAGEPVEVHFFGAPGPSAGDYADTVRVLDYQGPDNFSLQCKSRLPDEVLLLAKMPAPANLAVAVQTLLERMRKADPLQTSGALAKGDFLAVPVLNLKTEASFPELCGRPLLNPAVAPQALHLVRQDIRFSMDEKGASMASSALIAGFGAGPAPATSPPRRLLFDKPFLVLMCRTAAPQPYLVLWVANAEGMVRFVR